MKRGGWLCGVGEWISGRKEDATSVSLKPLFLYELLILRAPLSRGELCRGSGRLGIDIRCRWKVYGPSGRDLAEAQRAAKLQAGYLQSGTCRDPWSMPGCRLRSAPRWDLLRIARLAMLDESGAQGGASARRRRSSRPSHVRRGRNKRNVILKRTHCFELAATADPLAPL